MQLDTYLALASLTRTLGLAKSSRNLWLCSNTRRSRSSDMDWRPARALMMGRKTLQRDCDCENSKSFLEVARLGLFN